MSKIYCYVNENSNATKKLMTSFAKGCEQAELVSFSDGHIKEGTLVLRSRSPEASAIVRECWHTGQDFIFIDTGYFLNKDAKNFHRATKNHFQNFTVQDRPSDRWERFQTEGVQMKPWRKSGSSIMVCPPSEKSLGAYDFTAGQWTDDIVRTLQRTHPDKNVFIRQKPKLNVRRAGDTLEDALIQNDVFAVASCQGGVAIEAALLGFPAYVHHHNAATPVAQTSFTEQPVYPDRLKWVKSISYDQFTTAEMESGLCASIVI